MAFSDYGNLLAIVENKSNDTGGALGNISNSIEGIFQNIGKGLGISNPSSENESQSFLKELLKLQSTPSIPATTSAVSKVELGDLNISGTIELKINGETSKSFGAELLHNPIFIRDITKMVHMATASAFSGRQPQKV